MKKKNLLFLLCLLLPLFIIVGYSTWVIIYNVIIEPLYIENEVTLYYPVDQIVPYNGSQQVPKSDPINKFPEESITYEYRDYGSIENYVEGKPINVGIYDFKITIKDVGFTKVKFTIRKNQLYFKNNILSLDYNNQNYLNISTSIKSQIICVDEFNNEFTNNPVTIKSITNGTTTYNSSTNSSIVIGSTYLVEYQLAAALSNNYSEPSEKLIFKYKSALIGSTKYTIEDAIASQPENSTVTISFLGSTAGYYTTAFCSLTLEQGYPYSDIEDKVEKTKYPTKRVFKIKNGNTLYVPYSDGIVAEGNVRLQTNYTQNNSKIYSALVIPENIALVFGSQSSLTISATIGTSGSVGNHGVLMNNGIISMESNSNLNSFGFLKGLGDVILRSGSKAYDIMCMYDWPGGSNASGMISNGFPVVAWSFHNISCPMKIMNGAELWGYSFIYMSIPLLGVREYFPQFNIIGGEFAESGSLFVPSSGNTDQTHYIYKYSVSVDDSNSINTSIDEYNQNKGNKDFIEIHGNYSDATFNLELQGVKFETSPEKCMPLSFINVIIKNDSNINGKSSLKLSKSSYVFLAGTYAEVEEGTELYLGDYQGKNVYLAFDTITYNASAGTYDATINDYFINGKSIYGPYNGQTLCVDKSSAYLILNGKLYGTGNVGGKIISSTVGAELQVSNFKIESVTMKNDSGSIGEALKDSNNNLTTCYAYGNVSSGSSFEEKNFHLASGNVQYTSSTSNDIDYYFIPQTDLKVFNFKLYDENNQEIDSKKIYAISNGLEGEEKRYTYTLRGIEFSPYKKHYTLLKWGLKDTEGNIIPISPDELDPDNPIIFTFDESNDENNIINFYAEFSPITYTIVYSAGIKKGSNSIEDYNGTFLPSSYISEFTIESFTGEEESLVPINLPTPIIQFTETTYWYVGNKIFHTDFTITNLTKAYLEEYLSVFNNSTEINLYCEYNQNLTYNLVFKSVDSGETFSSISITNGSVITLPSSTWNGNAYKERYLKGFYFVTSNEDGVYDEYYRFDNTQLYDNDMIFNENYYKFNLEDYISEKTSADGLTNVIYIYCYFKYKEYVITYKNTNNVEFSKQYFITGQTIKLEDDTNENNSKISLDEGTSKSDSDFYHIRYTFMGWKVDSSEYNSGESNPNGIGEKFDADGNLTLIARYNEYHYNIISADSGKIVDNAQVKVLLYDGDTLKETKELTSGDSFTYEHYSKIEFQFVIKQGGYNNATYSYSVTYQQLSLSSIANSGTQGKSALNITNLGTINLKDDLKVETTWSNGYPDICLPSGTLITMYDGTTKKIEDLDYNDELLVFNHNTGKLDKSYFLFNAHAELKEEKYEILNLIFDNGTNIEIAGSHVIFDYTLKKYISINMLNVNDYIGHEFYFIDSSNNQNIYSEIVILSNYEIYEKITKIYSPASCEHLNFFANGVLMSPAIPNDYNGWTNYFELSEDLKFNEDKMIEDINKYGLFTYEEFIDFIGFEIPEEFFDNIPAKYFKISIGKNLTNRDEIIFVLKFALNINVIS